MRYAFGCVMFSISFVLFAIAAAEFIGLLIQRPAKLVRDSLFV